MERCLHEVLNSLGTLLQNLPHEPSRQEKYSGEKHEVLVTMQNVANQEQKWMKLFLSPIDPPTLFNWAACVNGWLQYQLSFKLLLPFCLREWMRVALRRTWGCGTAYWHGKREEPSLPETEAFLLKTGNRKAECAGY